MSGLQFRTMLHSEIEKYGIDPYAITYGNRHDFVIDGQSTHLIVTATFVFGRRTIGECDSTRRRIAVRLIEYATGNLVASSKGIVTMHRSDFNPCRKDFDITLPDAEPMAERVYSVEVVDESRNVVLGSDVVHIYDSRVLGNPENWYTPLRGAIKTDDSSISYIGIEYCDYYDAKYYFELQHNFTLGELSKLPELQVRLHTIYSQYSGYEVTETAVPVCIDHNDGLHAVSIAMEMVEYSPGDFYYAELVCMNCVIAGMVFRIDGKKSGMWGTNQIKPLEEFTQESAKEVYDLAGDTDEMDFDTLLNNFISQELHSASQQDIEPEEADEDIDDEAEEPEESLTAQLDHLTGLRAVKEKLISYEHLMRFNRMRGEHGLPMLTTPLHAMFLGSPGTGKTTVAKLMGSMLRRAGVLSRGHVVVRERANLLGQNYNSESEKTLAAIEEAQGGILFIDEAYQLYQPNDPRDPGKFVIDTLLTALANEDNRDWMLILAGYPKQMTRMFEMNPGLQSRIPQSNIYTFDDFNESELMEIAERYLEQRRYTLSDDARKALQTRLCADYRQRNQNFGNARHVINLIQTEIIPAMAMRVMKEATISDLTLTQISAADIPQCHPAVNAAPRRIGFGL